MGETRQQMVITTEDEQPLQSGEEAPPFKKKKSRKMRKNKAGVVTRSVSVAEKEGEEDTFVQR